MSTRAATPSYSAATGSSSGSTASSSAPSSGGGKFRWRVDSEKNVVVWNFERRGWIKTEGDDWNIYWANKTTIKNMFNPENGIRLVDGQYVNHFPNHYELTRKDLMVKNIKRYKKEMLSLAATATSTSNPAVAGTNSNLTTTTQASSSEVPGNGSVCSAESLDFLPTTYTLPADYSLFVEEFRRNPNVMWIMKPCSKAQGKGIFIINKLSQTKKWANQRWTNTPIKEGYVVSRYIENPLLVGGKKFDLRMYVLVLSYRPMQALVYREGFARFCNVKYSAAADDMDNPFMHLTNVAVQKNNEDYNSNHGGKWSVANLCLYVEATRGRGSGEKLLRDIHAVMLHALKAVQNVIINDPHSFECYGYDIIIDDNLKPWLVEVNASPSLSTTTREDRNMKSRLLRDVLELAVAADAGPDQRRAVLPPPTLSPTTGFMWLLSETAQVEADRVRTDALRKNAKRASSAQWRSTMKERSAPDHEKGKTAVFQAVGTIFMLGNQPTRKCYHGLDDTFQFATRVFVKSVAMGSERKLERKLRRKEEKKGLCDDTEVSSKVDVAPGDLEDTTVPIDPSATSDNSSDPMDERKAQRVMPIGELPSRQKPKTGKSPRKKKKKPEEDQEVEPVEFRVNGILVDRDVKGGAKANWMGVYMVLFRTSTPLGQRVAFILIGLVTISVSVAVLDSVKEIRDVFGDYLLVIEFGFTMLFTVEYGLRIACLRKPGKFIFSLLGFVDMCALVPSYFAYIFPEARPLLHLAVLRVFRVMRVFRLMRLARFVDASAALTDNIETNRRNIAVFLVALFTVILVIGCAMYLIEGDRQFGNIPVSLYWTVVTITTVGYGDISPQTIVGRILATVVMFVGYGIIASPTLLSAPPAAPVTSETIDCPKCTRVQECVRCFQKFHQESANFCCMCAEPLRKPELKAARANGEERKRTPKAPRPSRRPDENGFPVTPTQPQVFAPENNTGNLLFEETKSAVPLSVPPEEIKPTDPTSMIC